MVLSCFFLALIFRNLFTISLKKNDSGKTERLPVTN